MKICDRCKKNPASLHLTEIRKGKREEFHLCDECARKLKVPQKSQVTVNDLLDALMDKNTAQSSETEEKVKCPHCGTTFADFKRSGRFGCANDYKVFGERLGPILEKIHGSSKYIGKVPASQDPEPVFIRELLTLRQKLKEVVRAEEYEEAARIRDKIAELENQAIAGEDQEG